MLLRRKTLSKFQKFLQVINDCNIDRETNIGRIRIGPHEPSLVGLLDLFSYVLLNKSIDYDKRAEKFIEDTSTSGSYGRDLYKDIMEREREVVFSQREGIRRIR